MEGFVNMCVTPSNNDLGPYVICRRLITPSVSPITFEGKKLRTAKVCIINTPVCIENWVYGSRGYGTSHIIQIAIVWTWPRSTSDSHQISNLGLYTNSK